MGESVSDLRAGKMYRVKTLRVQFIREGEDGEVRLSVMMPESGLRDRGIPHTFDGVFRADIGMDVLQFQVSGYYMAFTRARDVKSIRKLDRE